MAFHLGHVNLLAQSLRLYLHSDKDIIELLKGVSMDTNSLQQLRTEIINRAQNLALDGQVNSDDKLAILMNLIRTGVTSDRVVRSAFDIIDQLADDEVKLNTYLDLLYEVDQMIARNATPDENVSDEPNSQPQDENYQA